MVTVTTTTGARCAHNADTDVCPFCHAGTLGTGAGTGNVASSARLAAAIRGAVRAMERERDTLRGYVLLGDTVSAAAAISPVLWAIGTAADGIGHAFYSDVTGETIERVARYIGAPGTDAERVGAVLMSDGAPTSYAARLGRRVALSIARGTGTGRGSMPTVTIDTGDAERALVALYRAALRDVPAFTLGDGHGHRRAMGDAERALVLDTLKPERSERAPLYAAWLDGMGDGIPTVRNGHGIGHVAPYVPERDAAPLRRGSLFERAHAVGADAVTLAALRVAWDIVNVPDGDGRHRSRVAWDTVRGEIGADVSADTVARRVRGVVAAVRARESAALLPDGAPLTLPDTRPMPDTMPVVVRTGRTGRRSHRTGAVLPPSGTDPIIDRGAGHVWARVGAHIDTCTRARCAPTCSAIRLVPNLTRGDTLPDVGTRTDTARVRAQGGAVYAVPNLATWLAERAHAAT